MTTWICSDGYHRMAIEADTAQEAAEEYVDGGDWADAETIPVRVWQEGDDVAVFFEDVPVAANSKATEAGAEYLVTHARGYHVEDGVRYYDDTMQQWYLADEEDLAILGGLLERQGSNAYSVWCSQTSPVPARALHRLGGDIATPEDSQRFIPLHDEALPTNAVCEHPDLEEWCQYGEIDGERCTLYWVFDGAPDWPADDEAVDRIVWEEC